MTEEEQVETLEEEQAEQQEETPEEPEETPEPKVLSTKDLLIITHGIEKVLIEDHNLSSAEMIFVSSILQAEATTNHMMGRLIRGAQVIEVHAVEIKPESPTIKADEN